LINADSSEQDTARKTVRLDGNVQVVFKGNHLRCDDAQIELTKKIITANGRVLENATAHNEIYL
jgi:LPS-assembly protein